MNRPPLNEAERRDWLRLARSENVGPISFRQLLRRYGSASAALVALPELAARGGKRNFVPAALNLIERELAAHHQHGARLITLWDADYPPRLAALDDSPPLISVRGQASLLHKPRAVAIVGARNASLNGRTLAGTIARDLGAAGVVTISGMARGIDTAVHQASLVSGTVAVLAGGVDNIYPPENIALYEQLLEHGCVLAEMPWGSVPRAQHFPRRNRIISGLAQGVVVVEAALQSGSLITARTALEQGRDVFAVPGSPLDPRAAGTNSLLKQGAVLVQNAADVLEHLPLHALDHFRLTEAAQQTTMAAPEAGLDSKALDTYRAQILESLGASAVNINDLGRDCGCAMPVLTMVLLELELAGRLQRLAGNRVCLIYQAID